MGGSAILKARNHRFAINLHLQVVDVDVLNLFSVKMIL